MTVAIVWTVIAGIGVIAGIVLIREALRDRAAVAATGKPDAVRHLLVRSGIRTEALRMVTQAVFLIIGVVTIDFIATDSPPPSWFGDLISWGLVVGSACITTNSVLNISARRRLDRLLIEEGAMRR